VLGETVEAIDDAVGVDGALDVTGEGFAGEFVDNVGDLEHLTVRGLVE